MLPSFKHEFCNTTLRACVRERVSVCTFLVLYKLSIFIISQLYFLSFEKLSDEKVKEIKGRKGIDEVRGRWCFERVNYMYGRKWDTQGKGGMKQCYGKEAGNSRRGGG